MKQDKIGELIKKIRKESNLTQEKFANLYGVTYQAVSKWENGKSLPDISILKKICEDYNYDLNSFLNGSENKRKQHKTLIIAVSLILIILIIASILLIKNLRQKKDFDFSALTTTCDNFKLFGSIAYSTNKTAIYISNITYCGDDNTKEYQTIECTLYEKDENTKSKISSYKYDEKDQITLENFLKDISFNIDNYSKKCNSYKENGLVLEIVATDKQDKTDYYEIPLQLEESCN